MSYVFGFVDWLLYYVVGGVVVVWVVALFGAFCCASTFVTGVICVISYCCLFAA